MWFRNFRIVLALAPIVAASALAEPGLAPSECLDIEGKVMAPVDCAEYLARLELLGKTEEARLKVIETRKRRTELERPAAPPAPVATPQPPSPPRPPGAETAMIPVPDRVLEVFGGHARLRYRGATLLVQAGSPLPEGGRVVAVSLDGVEVSEGRERRRIPLSLGDWR